MLLRRNPVTASVSPMARMTTPICDPPDNLLPARGNRTVPNAILDPNNASYGTSTHGRVCALQPVKRSALAHRATDNRRGPWRKCIAMSPHRPGVPGLLPSGSRIHR